MRALLRQYKIESLREYQHRSRAALNMQRQSASAAPVLRRDATTWKWGGDVSHNCTYSSTNPAGATGYGANATCEPLVPGGSATVHLSPSSPRSSSATSKLKPNPNPKPKPNNALDDAVYVDTRTTVYTNAPPVLADPRNYKIKVAAIAGVACCVPSPQVNSSVQIALQVSLLHRGCSTRADPWGSLHTGRSTWGRKSFCFFVC